MAKDVDLGEWTYDRLWDSTEVGWHDRNVRFWKSQAANVRGTTGGGVSTEDLAFSKHIVLELAQKRPAKFSRALDCGAGIGRVTDKVLRTCCRHVDLLEFVKKHLDKARASLGDGKSGCRFGFHCNSAQKFNIGQAGYDLVWCQWLLMYLTDGDAVDFLRRAGAGLTEGGVLLVKENVSTSDKATYFDDADGELWLEGVSLGAPISCVRTPIHYEQLFELAGLHIVEEWRQSGSERGIMDMNLWSLLPASMVTSPKAP